jgi:hypothetical protein
MVHAISTASLITFDGIIPRDSWTVHLSLEPVARWLRLMMTMMSLCVWVSRMCMSLLVTGQATVAVAPVVAGCETLGAHFMFVLRVVGLIPFERFPVRP